MANVMEMEGGKLAFRRGNDTATVKTYGGKAFVLERSEKAGQLELTTRAFGTLHRAIAWLEVHGYRIDMEYCN